MLFGGAGWLSVAGGSIVLVTFGSRRGRVVWRSLALCGGREGLGYAVLVWRVVGRSIVDLLEKM